MRDEAAATCEDVAPAAGGVAGPPAAADRGPPDTGPLAREVLPPTAARLRRPGRRAARVLACLTSDAVWVQDDWAVHRLPLRDLTVESGPDLTTVTWAPDPGAAAGARTLELPARPDGGRWVGAIEARRRQAAAPPGRPYVPEGVCLVRAWPDVPHVPVGWIESVGRTRRAADQGLRLRAGTRGADAVLRVRRERVLGSRARRAYGLAVRVPDAAVRDRLRRLGYAEQVRRLATRMLALLVAQAALLYLGAEFLGGPDYAAGPPGFAGPETPAWLGAVFGWSALLVVALWATRSPRLLRAAGLAVVAVTTVRGSAGVAAHLLALRAAGPVPAVKRAWLLIDPIDWLLMIAGAVLVARAWRLAAAARGLLPAPARAGWSPVTLGLTAVSLLAIAGWAERATYEAGSYLLRDGVDPVRERQARWAYREGAAAADRGDLFAAERSLRTAQERWERLIDRPAAPAAYRGHLALTHYRLGVVRDGQGRAAEAIASFARAAAIGTELGDDARAVPDLPAALAECQRALADWRGRLAAFDKDRKAWDLYEDGIVKARKQDPAAEGLFRGAIALWEEVLALPPGLADRTVILPEVARAYLRLAALYHQRGRLRDEEAALRQAVTRGEEALALRPDRPRLVQDNLDWAREQLTRIRELALDEEIQRLVTAGRWADADEAHRQAVAAAVADRKRPDADREATDRALAARLDRYAWFLAHCPDDRVRDPAAAARCARQATDLHPANGSYWFTLAAVEYRGGRWRDSQAALDELKAREGELDAGGSFLRAMNLHRLGQPGARAALRQGVEWMDHRRADPDPARRNEYELLRPGFEALRREAERLLDGKDPSGDRIGKLEIRNPKSEAEPSAGT